MQDLDHDRVSLHMAARPEDVYELVADVTRTPEFSPEITRCTWLDGATGPVVGARFKAVNKVPNRPAWSNKPVVTVADAPKTFAFRADGVDGRHCRVDVEFEPDGDGTMVTESYRVTRPVPWYGWVLIGYVFGRRDRRTDLRQGMEQTLQRMRAAVERTRASH